jgi:hypothetical protein
MPGLKNGRSFVGAATPRTWPTHYGRVPPRCPRIAINNQRSPPAATCEHEASAGFDSGRPWSTRRRALNSASATFLILPIGAGSCRGRSLSKVCPERSGGTRLMAAPLTGGFRGDRRPGPGGRPGRSDRRGHRGCVTAGTAWRQVRENGAAAVARAVRPPTQRQRANTAAPQQRDSRTNPGRLRPGTLPGQHSLW